MYPRDNINHNITHYALVVFRLVSVSLVVEEKFIQTILTRVR